MDKFSALKYYYGYDTFKEGQAEVIDQLLDGRDALCIMPTGAGKSVCYQIPALLQSGTTIVVSPLISLMKDQVNTLLQMDISAAYINSSLSLQEYRETLREMKQNGYRIVYVAPERLHSEAFLKVCSQIQIPFLSTLFSMRHIVFLNGVRIFDLAILPSEILRKDFLIDRRSVRLLRPQRRM